MKQKQQEKKDELVKEDLVASDKSNQNSSGKSSEASSVTNDNIIELCSTNILGNHRKSHRNRPYSATLRGQTILPDRTSLMKEILNKRHPWESDEYIYQNDANEPLTKSALIYRLMRSRLEANLAKSISASRERSTHKKKFSSSTT